MAFRYLPLDQIRDLYKVLVDLGFATAAKIDTLLAGFDASYVAGIALAGAPGDSLFRLLNELNELEQLADGSVPFAIFLANAEANPAARKDKDHVIQRMQQVVNARVAGIAPPPDAVVIPSSNERTKDDQRTDMLPFSFFTMGAAVGKSVARVVVPRYENGQPLTLPDGTPKRSLGTGWLLTPDLLITNHHVINARDDDKLASSVDLAKQALGTLVQFDYESPDVELGGEPVKALEAYSPLDGPLDYAILRLQKPQEKRLGLRLRRTPLKLPANVDDYPSLNIIQHPLGGPKMVALRNNSPYRATDTEILYFTDTQRGSSGSPVFDDDWQVAALHKKWTYASTTFQGKTAGWVNVGTQIAAILADLKGKPLLTELG